MDYCIKKGIYKAVFSDIDGTLLNTSHQIPDKTKQKIKEMANNEIPFVLVSARMPKGMTAIRKELGTPRPMICYSGALVVDEKDYPIYSVTLPEKETYQMYQRIRVLEPEVSLNIYSNDSWKVENLENEWVKKEMFITQISAEEADFSDKKTYQNVHKILCMGEAERIEHIEKTLKKEYPDIRIYKSKDTYLEIMSMKASKSDAIHKLEEYFGIQKREVVAFGDGHNDIDMLEYAGLGVAMGNADNIVQEAGDIVTDINDREGLKQILDRIF